MKRRYPIRFCYHPDGMSLKRPGLFGSWDSEGRFHDEWIDGGRPMEHMEDGSWQVTVELEAEEGQLFWWGVRDGGEWMLFGQPALSFTPSKLEDSFQVFTLGNRHRFGVIPVGSDGFQVGVWAPHARSAQLLIDPEGVATTFPLSELDGIWSGKFEKGWSEIEGLPYAYELVSSEGTRLLRADPYARRRQGPQRGVSDLYVRADGSQTHQYAQDPKGFHLLRFEAVVRDGGKLSEAPALRLFLDGAPLDAKALKKRLRASMKLHGEETWWANEVKPDGTISLKRRAGAEAYAVCLGPADALLGLTYEIADSRGAAYHDPWNNKLEGFHNWPRYGLVSRPVQGRRRDPKSHQPVGDLIIYEMHIGSLLGSGGNLRTSTFGEVAKTLGHIKALGFTAIALMPTNPSEGWRDWGYLGTSSMAHQEAYADPQESAEQSLLAFIRAAHDLDLSVFTDVVYNHVGGEHNDLWNFDGFKNPWFEWERDPALGMSAIGAELPERPSKTANALPLTENPTVRNTPWGPIPAYNKRPVFQFYIDHAMDCVERLGFDGIRFDFTHLIHSQPGGGGHHGWLMLQEINRRLKHFFPNVLTFAEEFPQHYIITAPVSEGGAGFDAMWNTEHQHRLIYTQHHLSVAEAAAQGKHLPLRRYLEHLVHPAGFSRPTCSVTVLSNHDEVGNAIQIASLVGSHPRGWDLARALCWLSLLSPGYPIIFQGTEDLATNPFTWGIPSSWDGKSHLSGAKLEPYRERHLEAIKDVLGFRLARRDLHSEVPISNQYLDEPSGIVGFRRAGLWVLANFSAEPYDLPEEIRIEGAALLSSESEKYGYQGSPAGESQLGAYSVKVFASRLD